MAQNAINRTASRMARVIRFVFPDRHHIVVDVIIELGLAPLAVTPGGPHPEYDGVAPRRRAAATPQGRG
jgi:hypothetical protein